MQGALTPIRQATAEDIPAILNLEKQIAEIAHWPEDAYHTAFATNAPERVILLAENQSALFGFLTARFSFAECELENIAVAPAQRRHGIGSQLLGRLIANGRERKTEKIFLEVRESNRAARNFYQTCGFVEIGRRKAYYLNPPDDALLFALTL